MATEKKAQRVRRSFTDEYHAVAVRRQGLMQRSLVSILRQTFCSQLAMRGAPARAIQELAGHEDLATTQRYMHLSPASIERAIRLLDEPVPGLAHGEILEAAGKQG